MSTAVLEAAALQPGQRVLDVGCGDGDSTLHAARRVGPRGLALGVDDSASMVERARRRATAAGLANVAFVRGDVRTQRFSPLRFDIVVSHRPSTRSAALEACFPNLARALRPGGRLVFVSFDDPQHLGAELRRAGLIPRAAARRKTGGEPSWLVTATLG